MKTRMTWLACCGASALALSITSRVNAQDASPEQEQEAEDLRRRQEAAPQQAPPAPQMEAPDGGATEIAPAAPSSAAPETAPDATTKDGEAETKKDSDAEKGRRDVGYVTITPTGGFRILSEDGNYMLRFGLSLGLKYEPVWTDGRPVPNPLIGFARPVIRGHFFKPWIQYFTGFELAGPSPFLLAANILLEPWKELTLRVGQVGTPVSRHTSTGVRDIFFADYASVPSYFWSGRQRGATLHGEVAEKLEYWAGLYGGSPTRAPDDPHNYIVEGRVTAHPFGLVNEEELPFTPDGGELPANMSFTLQGYHGKLNVTKENIDPTISPLDPTQTTAVQTMTTLGADIWLQWWKFIINAEYYQRYLKSTDVLPGFIARGGWGQIIAALYKNKFGIGARFNWLDPNSALSSDNVVEMEGQFTWWIKPPSLSLKLRYAHVHQQTPDAAQLASFPGFVLPFAPGPTNLATLQLTLVF